MSSCIKAVACAGRLKCDGGEGSIHCDELPMIENFVAVARMPCSAAKGIPDSEFRVFVGADKSGELSEGTTRGVLVLPPYVSIQTDSLGANWTSSIPVAANLIKARRVLCGRDWPCLASSSAHPELTTSICNTTVCSATRLQDAPHLTVASSTQFPKALTPEGHTCKPCIYLLNSNSIET